MSDVCTCYNLWCNIRELCGQKQSITMGLKVYMARLTTLEREETEKRLAALENLASGGDLAAQDEFGWGLVHYYCKLNEAEKLKKILEKNPEVLLTKTAEGYYPLQIAFQYEATDVITQVLGKYDAFPLLMSFSKQNFDDTSCMIYDLWVKSLILEPLLEAEGIVPRKIYANSPLTFLDIAAEVDAADLIDKYFKKNKVNEEIAALESRSYYNCLHRAVLDASYNALETLLKYLPPDIEVEGRQLGKSPLHLAAMRGDWKSAEILLNKGANINALDKGGETALYYAIKAGHEEFVKKLLEKNPKMDSVTAHNQTIFHAAIKCSDELRNLLITKCNDKNLINAKDLFGRNPGDLANETQNVGQEKLVDKLILFHNQVHAEDERSYLTDKGYCNGLDFLFNYYSAKGNKAYYFSMLKTMIAWSGNIDDLSKPVPEPLNKDFSNLQDLFDTFLAWVTWYLHSRALARETKLKQSDRISQYGNGLIYLFNDLEFNFAGEERFLEIFNILSRLHEHVHIELGGDAHGVSAGVLENGRFEYYDSNFGMELDADFSPHELTNVFFKTKVQSASGASVSQYTSIQAYYFDFENIDFTNYRYFSDAELPGNKEDVAKFQKQSASGFNHLHIAVLANSKQDIEKLLAMNYLSVNDTVSNIRVVKFEEETYLTKYAYNPRAIDLAVRTHNLSIIRMLLQRDDLDLDNSMAIVYAYENGLNDIVNLLLESRQYTQNDALFKAVLENLDKDMLSKILSLNKVSLDTVREYAEELGLAEIADENIKQQAKDVLELLNEFIETKGLKPSGNL